MSLRRLPMAGQREPARRQGAEAGTGTAHPTARSASGAVQVL